MKRHPDKGAILITIVVITAVLFVLGTTLAFQARVNTHLVADRLRDLQAFYAAEAGLAVAETQLLVTPTARRALTGVLPTGRYEVTFVEEAVTSGRARVRVKAQGRSGSARKTLTSLYSLEPYPYHPAFGFTLYQAGSTPLGLSRSVVEGAAYTSGDLTVQGTARITGNAVAAGEVNVEKEGGVGGSVFPRAQVISPPRWDVGLYRRFAATVLPSGAEITEVQPPGALLFVDGDATVGGTLPAGMAIVASGTLTVQGDTRTTPAGLLFLAAGEELRVHSNNDLRAVLYTPGSLLFTGPVALTGLAAGGSLSGCDNGSTFTYQEPGRSDLRAPLPGITVARTTWYADYSTIETGN